jgi:hypothetical protein
MIRFTVIRKINNNNKGWWLATTEKKEKKNNKITFTTTKNRKLVPQSTKRMYIACMSGTGHRFPRTCGQHASRLLLPVENSTGAVETWIKYIAYIHKNICERFSTGTS